MEDRYKKFQISDRLKNKDDAIESGDSVQELVGFTDEVIETFYNLAAEVLKEKSFLEAADCFYFLVALSPNTEKYWIGLGMSLQLSGNYHTAMDAYEMAAVLEVEDPVPYFYIAKCLFALNEKESAMQALELALEYSEQPQFLSLKQEVQEAIKLLQKRLQ